VNPHDSNRIPGTSSSGSAAAVASKMVPLALGTQTAGSIIRPASYCGVFGFKPTFGVVPRTGSLKTTDTLDTIGCFARSVDDIKLLFDVIRAKGSNYPYVKKYLVEYEERVDKKMKIGFLLDDIWVFDRYKSYAIEAFLEFINKLKMNNQLEISQIEPLLDFNEIHKLHGLIYNKTLSYYFKNEFQDLDKISDIIKELIEIGNNISTDEYINALTRQEIIRQNIEKELSSYDMVLTLSTAGEAPLINEEEIPDTCLIWTFLGMPALNIPLFKGPNHLPYGLQVISSRYSDYKILDFAERILLKT
jgi:Asp-tRNA(Asn)/Glu-tRNA(Gln) amidotransferase A subunit family amidase